MYKRKYLNIEKNTGQEQISLYEKDDQYDTKKLYQTKEPRAIWTRFTFLLIFRIFNCIIINNIQHPDEIAQSIEVAHYNTFGYGDITWEWKGERPIRGPLHVIIFTILFKILKILNLDDPILKFYAPKIFMGIMAAIFDIYLYKFSLLYFQSQKMANITIMMNMTNPQSLNLIPRTLINSMEAIMLIYGLHGFFQNSDNWLKSYIAVGVQFLLRPVGCVPWVAIWGYHFIQQIKTLIIVQQNRRGAILKNLFQKIKEILQFIIITLVVGMLIDFIYYRRLVFTAYNFYYINIVKNVSQHYGKSSVFFYFLEMIRFNLLHIIYILLGVYYLFKRQKYDLLLYSGWILLFFSMITHKEYRQSTLIRFVTMITPLLVLIQSYGFYKNQIRFFKKFFPLFCIANYLYLFNIEFQTFRAELKMSFKLRQFDDLESLMIYHNTNLMQFYSMLHKDIPVNNIDKYDLQIKHDDQIKIPDQLEKYVQNNLNYKYVLVEKNSVEIEQELVKYYTNTFNTTQIFFSTFEFGTFLKLYQKNDL